MRTKKEISRDYEADVERRKAAGLSGALATNAAKGQLHADLKACASLPERKAIEQFISDLKSQQPSGRQANPYGPLSKNLPG